MEKSKSKSKSKPKRIVSAEENQGEAWSCDGPCLMIRHTNKNKKKPVLTFYDISNHQHHSRVSPEIQYDVFFGAQGHWLLLADSKNRRNCCILNSITMEKQQLPPVEDDLLSSNDRRLLLHDCTVIIMVDHSEILSCQIGADEFTRHVLDDVDGDYRLCDAIIFQDKMYYIACDSYDLLCSQVSDDLQFSEVIPGEKLKDLLVFDDYELKYLIQSDFDDYVFKYLIQSDDQLLFLDTNSVGMGAVEFRILRADFREKGWETLYSIGDDRAIFVDEYGGFSAAVPTGCVGIKGNCIYYSHTDEDISNDITTLHAYDLTDQSDMILPSYPFKIHGDGDVHRPVSRWLHICNSSESEIQTQIV